MDLIIYCVVVGKWYKIGLGVIVGVIVNEGGLYCSDFG